MRAAHPPGGPHAHEDLEIHMTAPSRRHRIRASLRPEPDDTGLVEHAPQLSLRQVLARFWPRLRPLRKWLLLALLLLAAAPLIAVLEVLLFKKLVDDVLVPADFGPLPFIVATYIGLNLVSAVVSGVDDYLSTWISQRFLVGLRSDVFRHVLALPFHVHDRRRLGDVMSRLTSDVAAVEAFMIANLTRGISAVLQMIFYVGALFWLQWQLAAAAMVVVPLLWWISLKFAGHIKVVSRERRRRAGSLSAVAQENLASGALVQTYGREDDAAAKYQRENQAIVGAELAASRVRAVFLPLVDLAELVAVLVVIGLGTWALATDRLTLGGLLAFLTLLAQCYGPVRGLGNLIPRLFSASAGAERIVELLDEPIPQDAPDACDLRNCRGAIELDQVTTRYPGANKKALTDVSFRIQPGEVVGLAGPSGAGKSTLIKLLSRHLDPTHGVISLDGHDLRNLTTRSVRRTVTVVLQDTMLLDASVYDNIAFARPEADRAAVEEAARRADADTFIQALPEGYATRVGQQGRSLSGGQRQRIALARALLLQAQVLVLDEPTTGLDADTARLVMTTVLNAASDQTVIIASHDPTVLDLTDRVIHLRDGCLERDEHQQAATVTTAPAGTP